MHVAPSNFADTKLPWLFLVYALPAVVLLSITVPPFQVADELAHVLRADQIARGKMVSDQLGGTVDGGFVALGSLYENMWFHPEVKQTVALARQARAIEWFGPKDHVNFQNTAQYGPLLYPLQAIGIWFGRFAELSVVQTLVLARLVNALAWRRRKPYARQPPAISITKISSRSGSRKNATLVQATPASATLRLTFSIRGHSSLGPPATSRARGSPSPGCSSGAGSHLPGSMGACAPGAASGFDHL